MEKSTLKILSLEDSVRDYEIICEMLIDDGFEFTSQRVENQHDFISLLRKEKFDIILSDFSLPGFDAFGALKCASDICPDTPVIVVSGFIGEETAIELIKKGAVDYVLKNRPERLPYSVHRALEEVKAKQARNLAEEERKKAEEALIESEQKYKLLSENVTDGIFTCRNGLIEYVNISMCHLLKCDEGDLIRTEFAQLIVPEQRDAFKTFIAFDSNTDQAKNIEVECLRCDDTTIFVELLLNYIAKEKLIYGVMHDITEKKKIQKRNVVKAIIQTEEKERAYFSKELHEGLGPLLSTIKLYLQSSERPKSDKSRKEIIQKAEEILDEALTAVKEISYKLSPHLLANYGLTAAIQNFACKLKNINTITIDFQSNLSRRMEMEIEVALYRATIECINNTLKYAKARNIYVSLVDLGNQIQLQYRDDGIGFDIAKILDEKIGMGLFNLQNRIETIGGEIKLFSNINEGVNYLIKVPVTQSDTIN